MSRRSPLSRACRHAGLALALGAMPAVAQEVPRQAVAVDYVGVEGVYLPVGTGQGVEIGDTLAVFASDTASAPLGLIRMTAASRSRSVAELLGSGPTLARGDTIYLELSAPAEVAAAVVGAPPVPVATSVATSIRQGPAASGPRLTGRVSLDVEARETRTSWEGDLFGTTQRRYATPVSSLSFRLSELPGDFTIESSMRASYRYSDGVAIRPTTSVRIYRLAAVSTFDSAPIEIRVGRFYNPHEAYSSYWDGALLRVGGRNAGVGVVAGFDPERGNEGLSQDVAKLTGFADLSRRFGSLRYDTDLSFHLVRPRVARLPDRSFAGWSQRVAVGRVNLNQRLRLDRDPGTGTWSLAQLRLRGGLLLSRGVRLRVGFGRTRPGLLRGAPLDLSRERDEMTAGLGYFGRTSFSLDVGSTRWAGEQRGLSVSGNAGTEVGDLRLYVSGRRWWRGDMQSLAVAPGVGFDVAGLSTRLGYQLYRTESTVSLSSHSGSVELSARPTPRVWVTLRGEEQWGGNLSGTRLRLSVGRSF
jgi:hypothetical protein